LPFLWPNTVLEDDLLKDDAYCSDAAVQHLELTAANSNFVSSFSGDATKLLWMMILGYAPTEKTECCVRADIWC